MAKKRLDQRVFELGLVESRERAKTSIMSGIVYVNGQKVDKAGHQVSDECTIEVRGAACPYVSRGGYKLEKALKAFNINPTDKVCIDCGASTGGFTDVLLKNGAKKVYAVDVGYGQLAWSLRTDERVVNIERQNARHLTEDMFSEKMDLAVMDLAFISIQLIIPVLLPLLKEDGEVVCLIKPQFEAGREDIGKKGVVRDPKVHERVLGEFVEFIDRSEYSILAMDYSPIRGPEGNIEYLAHLKKGEYEGSLPEIEMLVKASHGELEK